MHFNYFIEDISANNYQTNSLNIIKCIQYIDHELWFNNCLKNLAIIIILLYFHFQANLENDLKLLLKKSIHKAQGHQYPYSIMKSKFKISYNRISKK